MSHYFLDLLDELKSRLARMTAMVQQTVEQAIDALFAVDQTLMRQVIDGDARIDEEEVKVEQAAINILALHQPAAGDLRLVTTILKVNSDFERIADCAVNVAQRVQYLRALDRYEPPPDLRIMANAVIATLRDTIQAFNLPDENLARRVLGGDDVVDALYQKIIQDVLHTMQNHASDPSSNLSNIMVAKNLERIADHCTNIAENVIYLHCGRIIRHSHAG